MALLGAIVGSWLLVLWLFGYETSAAGDLLLAVSAVAAALGFFQLRWQTMRRICMIQLSEASYRAQLEEALREIESLSGLLPICAGCKNIRDDDGNWQQVEVYVRDRADVEFTHSLCPSCSVSLYPELDC